MMVLAGKIILSSFLFLQQILPLSAKTLSRACDLCPTDGDQAILGLKNENWKMIARIFFDL